MSSAGKKLSSLVLLLAIIHSALGGAAGAELAPRRARGASSGAWGGRRLLQQSPPEADPATLTSISGTLLQSPDADPETLATISGTAALSHSEIDQRLEEGLLPSLGVPAIMAEADAPGVFDALSTVAGASALSHASIDAALLAAMAPGPSADGDDQDAFNPQALAPPGVSIAAIAGASDLAHSSLDAALAASAPGPATTLAQIAAASEFSHSDIDAAITAARDTTPAPASAAGDGGGEAEAPVAILEPHELLVALAGISGASALSHASIDQALLAALAPAPADAALEEGAEGGGEQGGTAPAITDLLSTVAGGSALSHASIDQALLAAGFLAPAPEGGEGESGAGGEEDAGPADATSDEGEGETEDELAQDAQGLLGMLASFMSGRRQLRQDVPSNEPLLSTRPEEFLDQTFGTDPQEVRAQATTDRLANATKLPLDEPEMPSGFVPQELPFDDNLNEVLIQPDGTEDPLPESLPIDEPETPFVEAALADNVPELIENAPDPDPGGGAPNPPSDEVPADQVPDLVDFAVSELEVVQGAEGASPAEDAASATGSGGEDEADQVPGRLEEAMQDPVPRFVEESSPGNNDPAFQRVLNARQDVPAEPGARAPADPLVEAAVEDPSASAEAEEGADREHAAALDQSEGGPEFQAAMMDPITPVMEESPVATFLENVLVEPIVAAPRDPLVEILVEDPSAQVGPEEALASQEPQSAAPIEEGPLDPFTPAMELSPAVAARQAVPFEPLAAVPADPAFEAALEDPLTPMEEGIQGVVADRVVGMEGDVSGVAPENLPAGGGGRGNERMGGARNIFQSAAEALPSVFGAQK